MPYTLLRPLLLKLISIHKKDLQAGNDLKPHPAKIFGRPYRAAPAIKQGEFIAIINKCSLPPNKYSNLKLCKIISIAIIHCQSRLDGRFSVDKALIDSINLTVMERTLREMLAAAGEKLLPSSNLAVDIEIPKEEGFGDLATPVAMGLAKSLKKAPRKIAEELVAHIDHKEIFGKIDIAGPGFINFAFTRAFLCDQLKRLLGEGESFLTENIGMGKRVQIEFVSANPTGPLHLGHGRGAAVGAALANLLEETGFNIKKEFYVNDAGKQVRLLGLSVFAKYKALCGAAFPFPEDGYHGYYVDDLAAEFKDIRGCNFAEKRFEETSDVFIDFAYLKMLDLIKKDLEDFGVLFDTWQSERDLYSSGEVIKAIDDLRERGYIFDQDGATWFRSTAFGDDKDRVIIKNDGEYTYFAPDIAYHRNKILRGFDELVDIWGADHHGYIPRMQAVIQALGLPADSLRVLLVQMVSLLKGGQPVQMSKRSGEFITLREVMDDIGPDTTKFLFLTRRFDSHLDIDIEVAKAQSSENPVFYVQYAHARINSIFAKAAETGDSAVGNRKPEDFNGDLFNEEEMRIVKKLLLYTMVLRGAALAHEPHRITFYLQELAGLFHPYYHKFKVITEDAPLTTARLSLCRAIMIVLRHGLKILGVNAPDKM
jgi:arginyl-tRNA synthetase